MRPFEKSLDDKVALVTGAGSGIGKATAKFLASAGARVAALGTTASELNETCDEIRQQKGEAICLVADVSDESRVAETLLEIEQRWGRLDIVVANAGINGVWAPLEKLSGDDWDTTLGTNLKGTFLTVKYSVPLLKRAGGSVIVVSSVNGVRIFSNTGATAYSCSKAGQVAFARMIALELAPHRIRVNTVYPGAITTHIEDSTTRKDLEEIRTPVEFPEGQIPLTHGRSGSAAQVAQLIWFLASDASSHITGTEVFIDGGQSLLQG